MVGFEATAWINHPPDTVFDFVMDTGNAPKVVKGVTHMEKISEGPVGVGTRFRETRLIKGKEQQAELEVTLFDPARRYSVTVQQSGIEVTYHYTFVPEQGGTRVDLVCEVKGDGFKKLVLPLVAAIMKKEDADHLQTLKSVMETTS